MIIGIIYNHHKNKHLISHFVIELKKNHFDHIHLVQTLDFADGIEKTQALIDEGCEILIAAGGDGTVLSVVNGVMKKQKPIPMTILPLGSANDFARELNIVTPEDTLAAVLRQNPTYIDIMKCTFIDPANQECELYANSSAGVGLISAIFKMQNHFFVRTLKKYFGSLAYILAVIPKLLFPTAYNVELKINNVTTANRIGAILIRKTKITGPISLIPFANPTSGLLEAIVIYPCNFLERISLFLKFVKNKGKIIDANVEYFGNTASDNKYHLTQPRVISVTSQSPVPVDLNGDFVGYTPCRFEILPTRLLMLMK